MRLQVDVGFGDAITPEAAVTEFPALLDFPVPRLRVYPRETVVAEKLEVSEQEVAKRIAELAAERDKTPQKLRAEMDRDGSLDSLRWRLRQEKALDLLVSRATISEAQESK